MDHKVNRFSRIFKPSLWFAGADRLLLITVGIILVFGLIMLASASSVNAYQLKRDTYFFINKQLMWVAISLVALFFFSQFDYKKLKGLSLWIMIIHVLFLIAVLIVGNKENGTRGWINLFGFNFQPSETLKLFFIIYLAAIFSGRQPEDGLKAYLATFVLIGGLVAAQPDIGTLFIIALSSLAVLLVAKVNWKVILSILGIGFLTLVIAVSFSAHQKNRIKCLVDSDYEPQGACFQVNQSLIAIGSGGFWGRGLGESRQKFLYLPEVQNDFIFAVVGEEMGFLATTGVLALFVLLFWRAYLIGMASSDPFAKIIVLGIGFWLVMQAILNIGGISRVLPMTGVPLPMISYGGSAMLAALSGVGILINISKQTKL